MNANARANTAPGLLLLAAVIATGCASKTDPSRANFRRGMKAYLEKRGDLCLGRSSWPIDIAESDDRVPAQDARQLPVLERLRLVTSTILPARIDGQVTPFNVRRFRLTATGRQQYIDRVTRAPVSPDDPGAAARADLCVVELGLGDIQSWEVQPHQAPPRAVVTYTYTVDAPGWTRDPGFQRVFPAVARVIRGAGTAQLVEGFTLIAEGWTANELLPSPVAMLQAAAP